MLNTIKNNWWITAIGGFALIAFGVGTLLFPGLSLTTLVLVMGSLLIVDGGYRAIMSIVERQQDERWWVGLLSGIVGLAAGVTIMAWPNLTAIWLLTLLAVWMVVTGIFDIVGGIRESEGRGWKMLSGIAAIVIGALLYFTPVTSALSLMWMVGMYAIFIGILRFGFSLGMRRVAGVERSGMLSTLLRDARWMMILRGALAIGVGGAMFAWPSLTITIFVTLFGLYALLDGLFTTITAISERQQHTQWGWLLAEGIASIAIGIAAFAWTGTTILALVVLVAARALTLGLLQVVMAVRLRREIKGEWLLALLGAGFIALGLLIAFQPAIALQSLVWIVGGFSIAAGILQIAFAFLIGSLGNRLDKQQFEPRLSTD